MKLYKVHVWLRCETNCKLYQLESTCPSTSPELAAGFVLATVLRTVITEIGANKSFACTIDTQVSEATI